MRDGARKAGWPCPAGPAGDMLRLRTPAAAPAGKLEAPMIAQIGDRIVIKGTRVGDSTRVGVITALRHADGTPPYEVRWLEDGHLGVIFPGPETHVEHATAASD